MSFLSPRKTCAAFLVAPRGNEKERTNVILSEKFKPNKKFLYAAISLLVIFAIFTVLVKTVNVAAANVIASQVGDTKIGFSAINVAFYNATHPAGGYSETWYTFTDILGKAILVEAAGFAVYGGVQLLQRKSLKKVDADLYVLAAIYVLLAIAYLAFELFPVNYRPVLLPESTEAEASYPSSHTMLACVIAGTGIIVLRRRIPNKITKISAEVLSGTVIFVTVLGRTLSGVHYLTDIVGGLLLSAAMIALFLAFPPKEITAKEEIKNAEK